LSPRAIHAEELSHAEFFEKEIRPLLISACVKCHGPDKQEGGLRLDTRAGLMKGGESGAAVSPGKPELSLLVAAIRREGDVRMPPDKPLSQTQVDALVRWVALDVPWPDSVVLAARPDAKHWAFEPVREPAIPPVKNQAWVQTPIDAFVLARLEAQGYAPSAPADRRTLIRRATFDLLGLPPSPEEVAAFVCDESPRAYERLVDRLLASPHYGEKQARHWLDIARYSDSKGYVYAREERFWPHAWAYRDWVVRAMNANLPYDRFLLLQLAADQVEGPREDLAAMGFLTLGRRFLGVTHDIVDDRIDVVTRGTMGLTVSCARCHDHKFDPFPTRDYYSLYGVFKSSAERLAPLAEVDRQSEFGKKLTELEEKLRAGMEDRRKKAGDRVRKRVADYLVAQLELHKYPEEGFDQILEPKDVIPAFVRRWRAYLERAAKEDDRVFTAWRRFRAIPASQFAERAPEIWRDLQAAAADKVHPRVAQAFTKSPASMQEVAEAYGKLFAAADTEWQARPDKAAAPPTDDPLLAVLYGSRAPCEVPREPIVSTESYFTSGECNELWKLQGDVERHLINSPQSPPFALHLVDCEIVEDARVMKRGNAGQLGDVAPRQFLAALSGPNRQPFRQGSGRLELARAIIAPQNPLTARVAVNRVWLHHFGAGLSRTPSDFGRRVDAPSHPELLDWLAARFVAEGWDLKKLHRQILLSAVYQQASRGPTEAAPLARLQQNDPENRLLWRMNVRRLSFEELHDAGLAVTGELKLDLGGKATPLFGSQRRTLYAQVDRQFLPSVLRAFDFANPDLHIPQRSETIVPQQALFFMNHPFLLERARKLAQRSGQNLPGEDAAKTETERIRRMYRSVYQREPTPEQLSAAQALLRMDQHESPVPVAPETVAWKYGFGEYQTEAKRVAGFKPLSHFVGKAWQGGPNWPDAALGWVQLTAEGGHAGNDRQHAAVRRWTAPAALRLQVQSRIVHPTSAGDGVRAYLVSSRQGLLKTADVHNREERFDWDAIDVEPGETLDFVVDLRENLNHEEYVWDAKLTEQIAAGAGAPGRTGLVWDSRRDFVGAPTTGMSPWEQLAQVLLAANEFLFID